MHLLIPCFIYRTRIEENLLLARFGPAYRAYQQKNSSPFSLSWRSLRLYGE